MRGTHSNDRITGIEFMLGFTSAHAITSSSVRSFFYSAADLPCGVAPLYYENIFKMSHLSISPIYKKKNPNTIETL